MNIWFTADTHFGHHNIIEYCKRPFNSTEEMDECYVQNHNSLVKDCDLVFHLGDVAFRSESPFNTLKGKKHLIIGNHDHQRSLAPYNVVWAKDLYQLQVGNTKIILCHYPLLEWNGRLHGSYHLYGHVHGRIPRTDKAIDAGVDCWGFRPFNLDEII